jgi:PhzF family phenazine biosynthesis protein
MSSGSLYRLSAFSLTREGGNPAGVWIGESIPDPTLIWRETRDRFHARNPFPVGGVVEDPATGAAAAALGGYLRAANLIAAPATIHIRQGGTMGRPSRLTVDISAAGGIVVPGTAVPIE